MFMLFLINASTKDKKKYIKHIRPCFTAFPNTEKRVENTTRSGVLLTNFKVFGNVVKHCLDVSNRKCKGILEILQFWAESFDAMLKSNYC